MTTEKFTDVKINAPVADTVFAKPAAAVGLPRGWLREEPTSSSRVSDSFPSCFDKLPEAARQFRYENPAESTTEKVISDVRATKLIILKHDRDRG